MDIGCRSAITLLVILALLWFSGLTYVLFIHYSAQYKHAEKNVPELAAAAQVDELTSRINLGFTTYNKDQITPNKPWRKDFNTTTKSTTQWRNKSENLKLQIGSGKQQPNLNHEIKRNQNGKTSNIPVKLTTSALMNNVFPHRRNISGINNHRMKKPSNRLGTKKHSQLANPTNIQRNPGLIKFTSKSQVTKKRLNNGRHWTHKPFITMKQLNNGRPRARKPAVTKKQFEYKYSFRITSVKPVKSTTVKATKVLFNPAVQFTTAVSKYEQRRVENVRYKKYPKRHFFWLRKTSKSIPDLTEITLEQCKQACSSRNMCLGVSYAKRMVFFGKGSQCCLAMENSFRKMFSIDHDIYLKTKVQESSQMQPITPGAEYDYIEKRGFRSDTFIYTQYSTANTNECKSRCNKEDKCKAFMSMHAQANNCLLMTGYHLKAKDQRFNIFIKSFEKNNENYQNGYGKQGYQNNPNYHNGNGNQVHPNNQNYQIGYGKQGYKNNQNYHNGYENQVYQTNQNGYGKQSYQNNQNYHNVNGNQVHPNNQNYQIGYGKQSYQNNQNYQNGYGKQSYQNNKNYQNSYQGKGLDRKRGNMKHSRKGRGNGFKSYHN